MKTRIVAFVAVLSLLLVGTAVVLREPAPTPTQPVSSQTPALQAPARASADAYVVPIRYVTLSLPTAGPVAHIYAAEGQSVVAGASLLALDNAAPRAALAQAQAGLAQAQANLALLMAGARPEEVAHAEVAGAEAALALVRAGPRPQEVAAAQALVEAAQAQVAQAQVALDQMTLRAPFAGVVGAIKPAAGQFVSPGMPLVVLGDASAWVLETDNLTELDVVHIKEGDRLSVRLDALPAVALQGRVVHIRPAGELQRGDVVYKVTLALDPTDAPLRWGMRAAVRKN